MKKVILFGATGNLGKEVAKELIIQGYHLTAVARNENRRASITHITNNVIIADACRPETLKNVLHNQELVISTLGKSVSPNDRSKPTFNDVDYQGNLNILKEAINSGVKKFVYVSALHAEKYLHLEYFKVHHDFSEQLRNSGIDYSIIKPPAIFSAFTDMIAMAQKGQLVNIGDGSKKTNPIFEGDLAKIVISGISEPYSVIEAGGRNIYTRRQLNEIVQNQVDKLKKVRTVPVGVFKFILPLIKLASKNTYDKFAFFTEITQHDTIAPLVGAMRFEDYIGVKIKEQRKI